MSAALAADFQSKRAPFTRVDLSAEHERLWQETRASLSWALPGMVFLFYRMMNPSKHGQIAFFTLDVPTAATDDFEIAVNPVYFFKLPLKKRVFVLAHEIMHVVLKHCCLMHMYDNRGEITYPTGKVLPFYWPLANIAADYVINDMLVASKVGELDPEWLHNPNIANRNMAFIDAYAAVFNAQSGETQEQLKKQSKGGGGGKGKQGQGQSQGQGQGGAQSPPKITAPGGQKSFDQVLKPGGIRGRDPAEAAAERNSKDAEWQVAIAASKSQGKLPADIERVFDELLTPQVYWGDEVKAAVARRVGSGSSDWRRADRRLIVRDIYAPGRSGHGCDTIVLGMDTSGSMGQREFDTIGAEMLGILEDLRPKRILVLWCDAKVHSMQEVTDAGDVSYLKPQGGGGTDFRPVFRWIEEHGVEPDALIYFTDMYGDFPSHAPSYPVIWARTTDKKPPFGDDIHIPVRAMRRT
jgi:predicted metal-dependent peptidase